VPQLISSTLPSQDKGKGKELELEKEKGKEPEKEKAPLEQSTVAQSNKRKAPTDDDLHELSRGEVCKRPKVDKGKTKGCKVELVPAAGITAAVTLEAHNDPSEASEEVRAAARITCQQGDVKKWAAILPKPVDFLAGSEVFSAAACQGGELYFFSPAGRLLLPCFRCEEATLALSATGPFLLNLTTKGHVSIWNVKQLTCILDSKKITFANDGEVQEVHVTQKGVPVIILSNHSAYSYDFDMKGWLRVSDTSFVNSDFSNTEPSNRGILNALRHKTPTNPLSMVLTPEDREVRKMQSTTHLEVKAHKSKQPKQPTNPKNF